MASGKKLGRPPINKGGRPTKYTEELADTIINYIKAGAYIETAAVAAGITKETFYDWLKKGAKFREGKLKTPEARALSGFSDAIKEASAKAELNDLLIIGAASKRNWTAAAWRLERMRSGYEHKEKSEVMLKGAIGTMEIPPDNDGEYFDRLGKFFGDPDELLMDGTNEPSDS